MMQQPPTGGAAVHPSMDQQQPPPPQQHNNDGSSPMMMDPPYQNQQPLPQVPQQPYMMEEEEEEEVPMIWIGNLQNWMDDEEEEKDRTLWIGDLQHWMDEDYINLCFAHTEEVFTSKVIRHKKTSTGEKSECYGFIVFKSRAIAQRILHTFNGTPMPKMVGSNFNLTWASSFGTPMPRVVVVGDDDDDITSAIATDFMLQQEKFTSVKRAKVFPTHFTPVKRAKIVTDYILQQQTFTSVKHAQVVTGDGTTIPKTVGGAPQFPEEIVNNSIWENMLKWLSLSQLDGICTAHIVRATHRVYEIAAFLKSFDKAFGKKCSRTPAEVEELLDELQGYVGSINVAKELHSMGALVHLLYTLSCDHAGIGAKAAEVVSTMLQNNPRSQQLLMEADGDDYLLGAFFLAADATTATNVLVAISLLFRNNIPAITAFRQAKGYEELGYRFQSMYVNSQRKALNLIHCLVLEHNSDCDIVTRLGYHRIMMSLASSYCAEVREDSLRCLVLLTEVEGDGNSGQLVKNDDELKQVLPELIEGIRARDPDDRSAEKWLVEKLRLTVGCY